MPTCSKCGLQGFPKLKSSPVEPTTSHKVAFVVDSPNSDYIRNQTFQAGGLLQKVVEQLGQSLNQCLITPICACKTPFNRAPSKSEIECCFDRFQADIEAYRPDRIVLLGANALAALFPTLKLTDVRGQCLVWNGIQCIPTWNPSKVEITPSDMPNFSRDIEHAFDISYPYVANPSYKLATKDDLELLMNESHIYVLDIETTGLDPKTDSIDLIGIIDEYGLRTTYILTKSLIEENKPAVCKLLSSKAFIGHNIIAFDAPFIQEQLGVEVGVAHDTMLLHYALDERRGTHDLEQVAVNLFGVDKWKGLFESSPLTYLAMDCLMTAKIFTHLRKEADESEWTNYTESLLPTAHYIAKMSKNGILIDQEHLKGLGQIWEDRSIDLLSKLQQVAERPKFNPRSPKQVADLVYGEMCCQRIDGESTAQSCLSKLAEEEALPVLKWLTENGYEPNLASIELQKLPPRLRGFYDRWFLISGILDYRQLTHVKKLYVDNILDACDPDGRVRTHYLVHGTETGRLSSTQPNLQNIPHHMEFGIIRGKEVRDGFIATPGWMFVECDYKALELRVLAYYSKDEQLVSDILSNDLHTATASRMFGVPISEVTKVQRFNAKSLNFGVMYKRGAWDMARKLGLSQDKAQEFINAWFATYPKAKAWIDAQEQFAWENNYIVTPFGKKRRFPLITDDNRAEIGRQAINHPIQSTASEICYMGMRNVETLTGDIRPILTVHDSCMYEVEEQNVVSYSKEIKRMLEAIPLDSPVLFLVDVSIGDRWGSMEEI